MQAPCRPAATPLSVRDSWRIGNAGTSFCSAQSLTVDKALTGMFDAGYSITCRDAALPVGKLYKLSEFRDAAARARGRREPTARLAAAAPRPAFPASAHVDIIDCKLKDADVDYRAYQLRKRRRCSTPPRASAGYDSALQLGLRAWSPTSR